MTAPDLHKDLAEAAAYYHKQNQALRAVMGILTTAVVTFVPPSHTWIDMLARAAVPAAGTAGWVLYRGKYPVVSVAEVHDVISYWESWTAARNARRTSLAAGSAPRPVVPPAPATPDAAHPSPPGTTPAAPDSPDPPMRSHP